MGIGICFRHYIAPAGEAQRPSSYSSAVGSAVELRATSPVPGSYRSVKILIANRGEIAVRVIRACREMGLPTVAVYSDCDRAARHVREARSGVPPRPERGGPQLSQHRRRSSTSRAVPGAEAVHPGYGFLAENAAFARACRDAGLTFIGPSPEAIALMGSKTAARAVAIRAGVPVVPGYRAAIRRRRRATTRIARAAGAIGYPLVVKAVAGGGGKGMRVVEEPADLLRGDSHRAIRGRRGLRRHERLPRAPPHAAAPHRDPAARRSLRHRRAVCRTRVLDSAAAPESGRGVAVDRGQPPHCAQRMAAAAAAVARTVELHQRGNDRVPARRQTARSISSR